MVVLGGRRTVPLPHSVAWLACARRSNHCAECSGKGGVCRAAPCTRRHHGNRRSKVKSRFAVGRRGGAGCGGRCKYVHVSSVAACSCALSCAHGKTGVGRPAQPARGMPRAHGANGPASRPRPTFDSFPVTVGKSIGLLTNCWKRKRTRLSPRPFSFLLLLPVEPSHARLMGHGVERGSTLQERAPIVLAFIHVWRGSTG